MVPDRNPSECAQVANASLTAINEGTIVVVVTTSDGRYGKRATMITTNLEYEEWYGFLGQKQMVGALLDRLRHRCTTVRIDGPSLRTPEG